MKEDTQACPKHGNMSIVCNPKNVSFRGHSVVHHGVNAMGTVYTHYAILEKFLHTKMWKKTKHNLSKPEHCTT